MLVKIEFFTIKDFLKIIISWTGLKKFSALY